MNVFVFRFVGDHISAEDGLAFVKSSDKAETQKRLDFYRTNEKFVELGCYPIPNKLLRKIDKDAVIEWIIT